MHPSVVDPTRERARRIAPFLVAATMACALGFGVRYMRRAEARAAAAHVEAAVAHAALRLEDDVASRLAVVGSIARERAAGLLDAPGAFRARGEITIESFGGLLAINDIDAEGVIREVSPLRQNRGALGRNVFAHPTAAPYARHAAHERAPTVTHPIDLFQGRRGVASYFPVVRDGALTGFVNGVFDGEALVRDGLRETVFDDYRVQVVDLHAPGGGEAIAFESPRFDAAAARQEAGAEFGFQSRRWRLSLAPRAHLYAALHRGTYRTVGAVGALAIFALLALAISLQRRAEAQRGLVAQRVALEAELRDAQKMEALGRLAGGVAHDFNNLLTVILAHVELARRRSDDPALGRALRTIEVATRRGAELTRGLLSFARRRVPDEGATDVGAELARLGEVLSRTTREDIHLDIRDRSEGAHVPLPPVTFERVVLNLVNNAAQAMPKGGQIVVATDRGPSDARDGGEELRLVVRDTGVGIPAAVRDRVFEPFFTTKGGAGGTGLGLASVVGSVREAGGGVTIESDEGVGTTVRITLPLTQAEPAVVVETRSPAPAEADALALLFVEDRDDVRQAMTPALEAAGFDVTPLARGKDALARLEGRHYDALLSDVVMPEMSGAELARRARSAHPDLPIVLCSGYVAQEVDLAELDRLGAVLIEKPFRPGDVARAIAESRASLARPEGTHAATTGRVPSDPAPPA